ncbi:hypothetical protein Pcinc_009388 [Petrolisthes cinctipes]|uniref:Uncharacterized protein n=1 Tax=Petrolisthes cinctipes TaxID=88211 RepID=A0AAE1GBG5_PETCI|nr:hypothetical protein Pcinc_009388 [Petrolisthes cinctipes]
MIFTPLVLTPSQARLSISVDVTVTVRRTSAGVKAPRSDHSDHLMRGSHQSVWSDPSPIVTRTMTSLHTTLSDRTLLSASGYLAQGNGCSSVQNGWSSVAGRDKLSVTFLIQCCPC